MNKPNELDAELEDRTVQTPASVEEEEPSADEQAMEDQDPEIRPTDIVFDCPNCGHELVIDYRGAGLTVHCTECGHEVEVPIPQGMEVSDLDETPAQIFAQLLQSRCSLAKSERRIAELERVVASLMERRSAMEKGRVATRHRCAELTNLCQSLQRNQTDMSVILSRMLATISEEQKL